MNQKRAMALIIGTVSVIISAIMGLAAVSNKVLDKVAIEK